MGNCQAAEISAVVIQHPNGRIERLYWPTTAEEIMKSNPGHHVALVTICVAQEKQQENSNGHVRFTRVRLLKPKDMLLVGQVYRLITSQEVNKALKARKLKKIKQAQSRTDSGPAGVMESDIIVNHQEENQERDGQKSTAAAGSGSRARHWRPKLQSISESVS
ncbi:uncharacterized protein A4U43_C05F23780 [Asparagus officinalis]|uniref:Uncharacterized protein n=1 Tax=Asparagus officinalis TaxID=4686 RepID=A0A5P1EUN6_ASPOF|nr:uncharacterized protein LOC109840364 [Asparagus officinalis]ONK69514.1 uncharacterized protein A4U43_C05F23780 [Asparagus officinalis]